MQDGWEDTKYKKRKNSNISIDIKRMYRKLKSIETYMKKSNRTMYEMKHSKPCKNEPYIANLRHSLDQSYYRDFKKLEQFIEENPIDEDLLLNKQELKRMQEIITTTMSIALDLYTQELK